MSLLWHEAQHFVIDCCLFPLSVLCHYHRVLQCFESYPFIPKVRIDFKKRQVHICEQCEIISYSDLQQSDKKMLDKIACILSEKSIALQCMEAIPLFRGLTSASINRQSRPVYFLNLLHAAFLPGLAVKVVSRKNKIVLHQWLSDYYSPSVQTLLPHLYGPSCNCWAYIHIRRRHSQEWTFNYFLQSIYKVASSKWPIVFLVTLSYTEYSGAVVEKLRQWAQTANTAKVVVLLTATGMQTKSTSLPKYLHTMSTLLGDYFVHEGRHPKLSTCTFVSASSGISGLQLSNIIQQSTLEDTAVEVGYQVQLDNTVQMSEELSLSLRMESLLSSTYDLAPEVLHLYCPNLKKSFTKKKKKLPYM